MQDYRELCNKGKRQQFFCGSLFIDAILDLENEGKSEQ